LLVVINVMQLVPVLGVAQRLQHICVLMEVAEVAQAAGLLIV
jgi:hypothetical protein